VWITVVVVVVTVVMVVWWRRRACYAPIAMLSAISCGGA
jgi:hypothetical protein